MTDDPIIPCVPAFATSGISAFFYHLVCSFLHLLGGLVGLKTPLSALGVRRKGGIIISQSCRSIFRTLMEHHVDTSKRILITRFHHHSFTRLMRSMDCAFDVLDFDQDVLFEPANADPSAYSAVVITHMLGFDYKAEWLARWKAANPQILIIEDRVQGGLFRDELPEVYDLSLYSTGQDKLPNFMGGGFARVHSQTHPQLYDDLADSLEALPFETNWYRFMFLVKKIPTVLIYNWRPATILIEFIARSLGLHRNALTDKYRKKNPGFMHGDYMIRPSPAQVQAMETVTDLAIWEEMQEEALRRFTVFLNAIPNPDSRESLKVFGSESSCCYFFARFPDVVETRKFLASKGVITIVNQTFLAYHEEDEHYLKNLITLPNFFNLYDHEIVRVAEICSEAWEVVPETLANQA